MPELPEVETVRRQMSQALVGVKIKKIIVRFGGRIQPSAAVLTKVLTGAKFQSFERRAKLLLSNFNNGWTLVTHLKMTGKYVLKKHGTTPEKHAHVIFELSNGFDLWFHDVRKFGYLKLLKTNDLETKIFGKENYGPEPLEKSFTMAVMTERLKMRPKKLLKPLLMDPTCIAGIGNIYADEACWHARTRPTRRINTLTKLEFAALYEGIQTSLKESIKHRGASSENYRDLYDTEGESVKFLHAYGKEKCPRCHGAMKKIKIGSRSAHFCPKCQS